MQYYICNQMTKHIQERKGMPTIAINVEACVSAVYKRHIT